MRHKTSFIFLSLCFALVSCTPKLDSDQTRSLGDESINGITTSIDSPGKRTARHLVNHFLFQLPRKI